MQFILHYVYAISTNVKAIYVTLQYLNGICIVLNNVTQMMLQWPYLWQWHNYQRQWSDDL